MSRTPPPFVSAKYGPCTEQRRADDHLSLVAGLSKVQAAELVENEVTTTRALSQLPIPIPWKPGRGSSAAFERVREQARLQVEARDSGQPCFELLPIEPDVGLCALPPPSPGDVFFDIEGDPFVGEHGLEYLFGYRYTGEDGQPFYHDGWATDPTSERASFEAFVDFVIARRERHPDLHVYHYAPYEPSALKRLMVRYASRENEIDGLLRGRVFIDLYGVVRNAIRAGVESYSIKRLEVFFGYTREEELQDANRALARVQAALELDDPASLTEIDKQAVTRYNADDCAATEKLRDWLEARRSGLVADGFSIDRPGASESAPSASVSDREAIARALAERLTAAFQRTNAIRSNRPAGSSQTCWTGIGARRRRPGGSIFV